MPKTYITFSEKEKAKASRDRDKQIRALSRLEVKMIKNKLASIRKKLGFSQTDICNRLDISIKTLYNYENGNCPIPSNILIELSKIYKCSTDYMLGIKKHTTLTITDEKGEVIAVVSDRESIEHTDYIFVYSED